MKIRGLLAAVLVSAVPGRLRQLRHGARGSRCSRRRSFVRRRRRRPPTAPTTQRGGGVHGHRPLGRYQRAAAAASAATSTSASAAAAGTPAERRRRARERTKSSAASAARHAPFALASPGRCSALLPVSLRQRPVAQAGRAVCHPSSARAAASSAVPVSTQRVQPRAGALETPRGRPRPRRTARRGPAPARARPALRSAAPAPALSRSASAKSPSSIQLYATS